MLQPEYREIRLHDETGTMNQDDDLLEGLRRRDPEAFRAALKTFGGPMLAAARAIVGPGLAEDVVQDAWITVHEKIDAFEGRASLGTWLHRIVVNRAISMLRSSAREVQLSEGLADDPTEDWFAPDGHWRVGPPQWDFASPDELLSAAALQDCIDKHLAAMTPLQRGVVILRDIEGEDFDAICNKLDISASNARVLLHRGRLRLAKMVDHFQETGSC
jgi:RNA polymerase sigma-70 factor (ECF subfamily)